MFKPAFIVLGVSVALFLGGFMLFTAGWDRPPIEDEQSGYRGTGMVQIANPREKAALLASQTVPDPIAPAAAAGPRARDLYQNVQVLGDLSVGQFVRVMQAMTNWVAPEQGCTYCHVGNLAADDKYQKVVSRKMLQMTQHINANWNTHVGETGVTCYTCHRGQNIPSNYWYTDPAVAEAAPMVGANAGQNQPAEAAVLASLPADPFTPYLLEAANIRIAAQNALPTGQQDGATIQSTEGTYSLMMHMSDALGVNCTFCHNSRAFSDWEQSSPQRVTAWHGIRMVRDVNVDYIHPLNDVFPEHRKGPLGDAFKANCSTCHQGVNKPLNGAQMAKDYPSLLSVSE